MKYFIKNIIGQIEMERCPFCKKEFKTWYQFQTHLIWHTEKQSNRTDKVKVKP